MTTLPQTAPVRIQRATGPSHLAAPGQTLPGYGGPAAAAASQGITASDVWRVLRANLWLIVIMVMASAVAGYVVNSYLAKHYSRFTAGGLLRIQVPHEVPLPGKPDSVAGRDEIEIAQNTHQKAMMHETTFLNAIQDDDSKIRQTNWFKRFQNERDPIAAAKKEWEDNWKVDPIPNTRLLRVEMTYSDPDDAKTIVDELVNTYISTVKDRQRGVEERKVDMLKKEQQIGKIDEDDIHKQLAEKEQQLGMDAVGTSMSWNGKQFQLDRLLQEEARIRSELAGYESRAATLDGDLKEGRTPAEVEAQINNSGRYLQTRQHLDDIDIEIDALTRKYGSHHETVIAMQQRRALFQDKMDETREELKSTFSETMRSLLKNEIDAAKANAGRVGGAINQVSSDLGRLNQIDDRVPRAAGPPAGTAAQAERADRGNREDQPVQPPVALGHGRLGVQAPEARPPQLPQAPDHAWPVAIFLGLALSLGIAFLREMTDTTVRSAARHRPRRPAQPAGHDPARGRRPAGGQAPGCRWRSSRRPHSMVAEQFRQVRTKLQHAASLDTTRSILVTSPSPGDGKTHRRVQPRRRPGPQRPAHPAGRRQLPPAAAPHHLRRRTTTSASATSSTTSSCSTTAVARDRGAQPRRSCPAAHAPANPTELLESQLFIDFIERALEEYDHVIFDSGPLLMVSDTVATGPARGRRHHRRPRPRQQPRPAHADARRAPPAQGRAPRRRPQRRPLPGRRVLRPRTSRPTTPTRTGNGSSPAAAGTSSELQTASPPRATPFLFDRVVKMGADSACFGTPG